MTNHTHVMRRNAARLLYGNNNAPIVYIHGYGCSQEVWCPLINRIGGQRCHVLLDLAGHGGAASDTFSTTRYATLDAYADDVLDVCEVFSVTNGATLVAHSIGCNIALRVAIARPAWFEKLILIGPSPCFLNRDDYRGGFSEEEINALLELLERNPTSWAENVAGLVAGGASESQAWLRDKFCAMDPVSARHFAKLTFFVDDRSLLPSVATPTTIVHHAHDALVPDEAVQFMASALPDAILLRLDVSGHASHMTHPQLLAPILGALLPTA